MREYRESMVQASELDPLELFYCRFRSEIALERVARQGKKHQKWKADIVNKASRKNSVRALKKLTKVVDGRRLIVPDPPRVVSFSDHLESDEVKLFFQQYYETLPLDRFSLIDGARRVVGVGSVGTLCQIVLLEADDGTPLFLQFKQAMQSVLEPYLGKSRFENAGRRVVEGQRLIQATSDMFLGWARFEGNQGKIDFYFRQLCDGKGKINAEELGPKRLAVFAGLCGKTLAFAHARSGDPMTIRGYIDDDDTFDEVIVEYADRYASCAEQDHARLVEAINDGAIEATRDL